MVEAVPYHLSFEIQFIAFHNPATPNPELVE
jgi:hypothetical protein